MPSQPESVAHLNRRARILLAVAGAALIIVIVAGAGLVLDPALRDRVSGALPAQP